MKRPIINVNLRTTISLVLALSVVGTVRGAAADPQSPLSPEQSLQQFRLAAGLRIEIAACEPEVVDPVAVRFDEEGRMWVVEMRDYPNGPPAGQPPMSRIKILEDQNGDGRYETATEFANELPFATGLQPWKRGVIVTLAGKVIYLQDTDGDRRADVAETWFTGFAEENPQLRANHPYLAADQQIYIANGLRGGIVKNERDADAAPLPISGLDFRFNPLTNKAEAITGAGQFGLTFDDWGNRFVCSNRNPLQQIVIENRYLQRNPQAAIPATLHDVADAGEASRIFPISRAWTTSNLHAGQFTAACGALIFRGDALTSEYYGNAFICDPTGNLVHCERLEAHGTAWTSRPAAEGVEFLASPDEWFRPVSLQNGPDGALYVVDMYRAVIEHPEWVPAELQHRPDARYGDDRGRIYRIVRDDRDYVAPASLSQLSSTALVRQLAADQAWTRETAARLLLERQDPTVHTGLTEWIRTDLNPQASIHSLWMLANGKALTDEILHCALTSRHLGVRRQAAIVWEQDRRDALREDVRALATHANPQLRLQALLSLAPIQQSEAELVASAALAGLDLWTERAAVIAAGSQAAAVLQSLAGRLQTGRLQTAEFNPSVATVSQLKSLVGALASMAAGDEQRRVEALSGLLDLRHAHGVEHEALAMAALTRFAQSLARQQLSLSHVRDGLPADRRSELAALIGRAEHAVQEDADEDLRIAAIELLSAADPTGPKIASLALYGPPTAVRLAAIRALEGQTDLETWRELVSGFGRESPTVRRAIIEGLLSRPTRTELLLDQIEHGAIRAGELDRPSTDQLLKHPQEAIRNRARGLVDAGVSRDRQAVLEQFQAALELSADPQRGRDVFSRQCATCHRVAGHGIDVAPDISDSRTKTARQILTDILQPNRAIDNNYISYTLVDSEGRVLTGILTAETATSITLKQPEGKVQTLLRSQIEELRSNGVSLMPEGLEKNVSVQEMADLVAFIKNWRYLDGRTPLQAAP